MASVIYVGHKRTTVYTEIFVSTWNWLCITEKAKTRTNRVLYFVKRIYAFGIFPFLQAFLSSLRWRERRSVRSPSSSSESDFDVRAIYIETVLRDVSSMTSSRQRVIATVARFCRDKIQENLTKLRLGPPPSSAAALGMSPYQSTVFPGTSIFFAKLDP